MKVGGVGLGGFLGELSQEHRDALRSRGWRRRFARSASLFHEGGSSDQVFVVLTGQVKVCHFTEDGREVILAVRGPGELLGELSAIDQEPRSATAVALEPVDVLILSVEDFLDFVEKTPRAAVVLLQMLSRRLRDADRKRIEFAAFDTVGRVARRLVEMAERFGEHTSGGVHITLPLSQQELAGWIGASREAVSKALQTLRARGWIETQRRGIVVLDPQALARRATL